MKNWTIKQRILGSFAVILILMAVMAGIAYTRLAKIDDEATSLRQDSTPGLYYSTMINAAWYENLLLGQQIAQIDDTEATRQADIALLRANSERLNHLQEEYEKTIFSPRDRALFDQFKQARMGYRQIQQDILRMDLSSPNAAVYKIISDQLRPAWRTGYVLTQKMVEINKTISDDSAHRIRR
ncbi:MCP four helix bundle domain-containing protein [Herbaspirillum lusitanum]|uniref:MCP four helix bundle domain-containing protein n=1 Tax=Herbaspirillum lusitanum TaxID=213312 RepID=UPI0003197026|nr:MCP four helix bundle domain-containing protein [Herbaspirillum lusitanum]